MPDLETLEYLIQLPIPKDTLLNYELWTLQKLGWKLNGVHSFEPFLLSLVLFTSWDFILPIEIVKTAHLIFTCDLL